MRVFGGFTRWPPWIKIVLGLVLAYWLLLWVLPWTVQVVHGERTLFDLTLGVA